MELDQLRYFHAVASAGSFTRAAESLHMTQSALSRSIAKLEDELGLRLFEREGNSITLNRFGQRFLQDSERAVSQVSQCARAVREMAGLEQGEVRIAISKEVFLDHLVRQFLLDYPDSSVRIYLLTTEQMREALENGEVDFAVTPHPPIGTHIVSQKVYRDQLELMLGAGHPLAGKKTLHIDQLKGERFVITNSNYNMDTVIAELCAQAGFEAQILYEGTSTDMPMRFIAEGKAVMITPRSITAGVSRMIPLNPMVVSIPLVNEYPGMEKDVCIAFKEGHFQSLAAQKFCERVVEFYSEI